MTSFMSERDILHLDGTGDFVRLRSVLLFLVWSIKLSPLNRDPYPICPVPAGPSLTSFVDGGGPDVVT